MSHETCIYIPTHTNTLNITQRSAQHCTLSTTCEQSNTHPHIIESHHATHLGVVEDKQYWRAITSAFSHLNILHIAFNCMSLWNVGYIEQSIGAIRYLTYSYLLVVLSTLAIYSIQWVLIHRFDRREYLNHYCVGYSCVVFGWLSINVVMAPGSGMQILGLVTIPNLLVPFFYLIFTSLLIQNASFIGHLAGIVGGFMIGYGLFDWVNEWLFFVLLVATAAVFIHNVHQTTSIQVPCLGGGSAGGGNGGGNARLVNGVLVRDGGEEAGSFLGTLFGGFKNPFQNPFAAEPAFEFDEETFSTSVLSDQESAQTHGLLADQDQSHMDVGPSQL